MSFAMDPITLIISLGTYIAAAFIFALILLCGDKSCLRGTPVAFVHKACVIHLPTFVMQRALPFIFSLCRRTSKTGPTNDFTTTGTATNKRAPYILERLDVFFECYVMPIGYHVLLAGGLYLAHVQLVPWLPAMERHLHFPGASAPTACPSSRFFCHSATGITFPPRTPSYICFVYYAIALASWLYVHLPDPAVIDARTHSTLLHVYPYDNLLFRRAGQLCRTCKRVKPPRSKHCRLCNMCVARFDHHCGWMGACIGLYNIRQFIAFLLLHTSMLAHGAVVSVEAARSAVQTMMVGGYVYAPTGESVSAMRVRHVVAAQPGLCVMGAVFGLGAGLVGAFAALHIWQVLRNVTTNEGAKWQAVQGAAEEFKRNFGKCLWEALRDEAEEEEEAMKSKRERELDGDVEGMSNAMTNSVRRRRRGGDGGGGSGGGGGEREEAEEQEEEQFGLAKLPHFDKDGKPVHEYDQGVWSNAMEVCRPFQFVERRTGRPAIPLAVGWWWRRWWGGRGWFSSGQ